MTSLSLKMQALIFFFRMGIHDQLIFLWPSSYVTKPGLLCYFRRQSFKNPAIWQCEFDRENDG